MTLNSSWGPDYGRQPLQAAQPNGAGQPNGMQQPNGAGQQPYAAVIKVAPKSWAGFVIAAVIAVVGVVATIGFLAAGDISGPYLGFIMVMYLAVWTSVSYRSRVGVGKPDGLGGTQRTLVPGI